MTASAIITLDTREQRVISHWPRPQGESLGVDCDASNP